MIIRCNYLKMPLSIKELFSLLDKSNAILVTHADDKRTSWNTKDRITFKCKCGNDAENQIRNIRKSGALCKECMAIQKSERISTNKTQVKNHIVDPLYKYCKSCDTSQHLKNFESDRKKDYTSICEKCRTRSVNSNRKKKTRILEKNKILVNTKVCLYCETERENVDFLKADNSVSDTCSKCRERRNGFEKTTKEKLKIIESANGEKKCSQCFSNRKYNCFSSDNEKCDICVNNNNKANDAKQEKRRIKYIKKLEKGAQCNMCIECSSIYENREEKCDLCEECRQYCDTCELYVSKNTFSKMSQYKCGNCIQSKFRETNIKNHGSSSYLNSKKHKKNRTKFTYEYMIELMNENGATFIKVIDIPLTKDSNVNFVCSCGNTSSGNFRIFHKQKRVKCAKCYQKIGYDKHLKTMMQRYGVKYIQHCPEMFAKIQNKSFKWKQFTFPSGKIIELQGYEHFAVRDLLKIHAESDIKCGRGSKEVPSVKYVFENKNKVYYPDIYIPKLNKIIEVKSTYTYNLSLKRNLAKKKSCIEKGYSFEFVFYNKKGVKINI